MSASLVGSEMCIRDSNNTSWDIVCFQETMQDDRPAIWRARRGHQLCSFCLLYTSDAADDM
eukprot:5636765-Alexandrium_andersonii.AAC.1